MKATFRKLATINASALVRTFIYSILFISLIAATLYFLINSPA
jgi:hypothetical protein